MIVRELLVKLGFQADIQSIEKCDKAIDATKASANQAAKAVDGMAKVVGVSAAKMGKAINTVVAHAKSEAERTAKEAHRLAGEAAKAAHAVSEATDKESRKAAQKRSREAKLASDKAAKEAQRAAEKVFKAEQQAAGKAARENQKVVDIVAKAAQRAAEKIDTAFATIPKELAAIDERARIFGKGFDVAKAKAESLGAAINHLTRMGVTSSDARMAGVIGQHNAARQELTPEGGGLFTRIGRHAMNLGLGIGAFFTAEKSVENFADFQQTMQKTGAAMRASQDEIDDLQKQALSWASKLGRAPREIGEAMMELASQGFEKSQVEKMTPIAVKLARAGLTDTSTATEIIGATTRSFYGEDASKAGHVGDIIALTHDLGGIKVPELGESMKYAAPAFHALGQSIEDLGSLTTVLGRAGIKGSMAGASLRTMALRLAAPSAVGKTRLEAAGLGDLAAKFHKGENMLQVIGLGTKDIQDAKGNLLPLTQIMGSIVAKTRGMGNVKKAGIFKQLFGLENSTEALAIADKFGKQFDKIQAKTHNATGALDRMYGIMNKGLIPAWQALLGKLEVVADNLVEALSPGLELVMRGIGGLIDGMQTLGDFFHRNAFASGSLKFALGALRFAFVALAPGLAVAALGMIRLSNIMEIGFIKSIVNATKAVWGFIVANAPIIAITAIIAGLVLVFQDLFTYLNGGDSALKPFWDAMYNFGYNTMGLFQELPGKITKAVGGIGAFFSNLFHGIYSTIAQWIDQAIAKIGDLPKSAIEALEKIPGIGQLLANFAGAGGGSPPLASKTPGTSAVAKSTILNNSSPVILNSESSVSVQVGHGASPVQIGQAVTQAQDGHMRKQLASVARLVPQQVR